MLEIVRLIIGIIIVFGIYSLGYTHGLSKRDDWMTTIQAYSIISTKFPNIIKNLEDIKVAIARDITHTARKIKWKNVKNADMMT